MEEEKKVIISNTEKINEMHWAQMDMFLEEYKKNNPEKYHAAQKKGEEIMSFDYTNPYEYVKLRDMKDYGSKVLKDIQYNGWKEQDIDEYDLKCLKIYLGKDDVSSVFIDE